MLARIEQAFEQAVARASALQLRQQQRIEEYRAQDPVALQAGWGPVAGGGANFRTRKLVQVSPGRVEFKPSVVGRVFPLLFVVIGAGALGLGTYFLHAGSVDEPAVGIFLIAVGSVFGGAGALVGRLMNRPIVFDRYQDCFWKGGSTPVSTAGIENRKDVASLSRIHALQLIPEHVRSSRSSSSSGGSSYYSYEINLVLDDGSRLNVIDHGRLEHIRNDAEQLAQFLGVPVWDVI